MAAAVGNNITTSLSLSMEFEVEEELSIMPLSTGQKEHGQENGVTSKKKPG